MKKWLALGLLLGITPSLWAAGNHPMAGCGLGYLLLANDDNSKVMQILGATTNGTFGSQTFGISSGTSGCTQDGAVKLARETEVFAEVNFDVLRREIAQGQGEFVNAFAVLLGAPEVKRPEVLKFLQTEYLSLFPSAETDPSHMLSVLSQKLAEHPELLG